MYKVLRIIYPGLIYITDLLTNITDIRIINKLLKYRMIAIERKLVFMVNECSINKEGAGQKMEKDKNQKVEDGYRTINMGCLIIVQ